MRIKTYGKITAENILKHLEEDNIDLHSTHDKLSIPIINRIYKKMKNGIKFESIKVNGDLIIDGHHRYVSSVLSKIEDLEAVSYPRTSATKKYEWSEVDFTDEEWDTEDKIKRLNKIDAEFNDLPLEKIIEIIK